MTLLLTSSPVDASNATSQVYETQNTTNATYCTLEKPKDWVFTVLPVYVLLITVFGIVFNLFVLIVFCFHKKACSAAEIYLSNLAAADLVLVANLPFWAINISNRYNWPFSGPLCKLVNLCITMNTYCSIYFLVLISSDRYVALVHPLSHNRMRRPKYAKLGCLLVWGFGLLMSTPVLMYRKVKHDPRYNLTVCFLDFPSPFVFQLYEGILTVVIFIIPITIISWCTFKIIQALRNRKNTQKKEVKATALVLAVVVAFLICWVPFHIIRIFEQLSRAGVFMQCRPVIVIETCKQIFIYVAFFNSVLNPLLYVIVGKHFRQKVKELFTQWSPGETSSSVSTSFKLS
ncbi:B2 bradykinin receptor-like [Xyrichtys novacula]|uniref:B2 bradykinin receptor-like n=1 Tax=Xyrichtys novacula TaxID=13765 RepID=A0AAV1GJP1_XYRNO|nr:B2 bradykinin receptor-like [Xyrichtys novacula]